TTIASIVPCSSLVSWRFAPSSSSPSGPPERSTIRLFLLPDLPRSVGFGPFLRRRSEPCPYTHRRPASANRPRPTPHTPPAAPPTPPPPHRGRRSPGPSGAPWSHRGNARAAGPTGTPNAPGRSDRSRPDANQPADDQSGPAGNASTRSARAVPRAHPAAPKTSPTAEQRRSFLEGLTPPLAPKPHPPI